MRQNQYKATSKVAVLREEHTRAAMVIFNVRRLLMASCIVYSELRLALNGTDDTANDRQRKTSRYSLKDDDMVLLLLLLREESEAGARLLACCIFLRVSRGRDAWGENSGTKKQKG